MTVFRFIYFAANDIILLFFIHCVYVQTAHAAQHQKKKKITQSKKMGERSKCTFFKTKKNINDQKAQ